MEQERSRRNPEDEEAWNDKLRRDAKQERISESVHELHRTITKQFTNEKIVSSEWSSKRIRSTENDVVQSGIRVTSSFVVKQIRSTHDDHRHHELEESRSYEITTSIRCPRRHS